MTPAPNPDPAIPCADCGTPLLGDYCYACGQHRRHSARLRFREVAARSVESLLDLDSAILRTFLGLTLRPGRLCREYVEGRRRRYMNPFAYFLLAGAANLLAAALASRLIARPDPLAGDDSDFATWALMALALPVAVVWRLFFRRAGRNLAETFVFTLYVLGHFVWLETLVLLPLGYALSEPALWTAYALVAITYVTFAATPFYREPWYATLAKLLLSTLPLSACLLLSGLTLHLLESLLAPKP